MKKLVLVSMFVMFLSNNVFAGTAETLGVTFSSLSHQELYAMSCINQNLQENIKAFVKEQVKEKFKGKWESIKASIRALEQTGQTENKASMLLYDAIYDAKTILLGYKSCTLEELARGVTMELYGIDYGKQCCSLEELACGPEESELMYKLILDKNAPPKGKRDLVAAMIQRGLRIDKIRQKVRDLIVNFNAEFNSFWIGGDEEFLDKLRKGFLDEEDEDFLEVELISSMLNSGYILDQKETEEALRLLIDKEGDIPTQDMRARLAFSMLKLIYAHRDDEIGRKGLDVALELCRNTSPESASIENKKALVQAMIDMQLISLTIVSRSSGSLGQASVATVIGEDSSSSSLSSAASTFVSSLIGENSSSGASLPTSAEKRETSKRSSSSIMQGQQQEDKRLRMQQ